jgi:hypothetical protein
MTPVVTNVPKTLTSASYISVSLVSCAVNVTVNRTAEADDKTQDLIHKA